MTQVDATLTSVTISWTEASSNPMYPVIGYEVVFNGSTTMVGLVTWYEITGLMSGTNYTVQVQGRNAAGVGEQGSVMATTAAPIGESHECGMYMHIRTFIRTEHTHTFKNTNTHKYIRMHTHYTCTNSTHTQYMHIFTHVQHTHTLHTVHILYTHTHNTHTTHTVHMHTLIDIHKYTCTAVPCNIHCVRTVYMYKNTCSTVHLCYGYVYRLREQNKTSTQSVRDMHAQGVPGA